MSFSITILVLCLWAVSACAQHEEWQEFQAKYNKTYKNYRDYGNRYKIFAENKQRIDEHNEKYRAGNVSYELAINGFADVTHEEFVRAQLGVNITLEALEREYINIPQDITVRYANLPTSWDWRTRGVVTPVKNQASCGSCWAFSAIGSLESIYYRRTGRLVRLSEQNLVDCTRNYGNYGCGGGWVHNSFRYILNNRGIDTEASYPYEAKDRNCRFNRNTVGATLSGWRTVASNNERALMQALVTIGPISTYMNAGHSSFAYYRGGVYREAACRTNYFDHAVVIVGYGTDPTGGDYWLVKNSWNTWWGENGYVRISRRNNMCGIASSPIYPVI